MSLFISGISSKLPAFGEFAKFGVLTASLVSTATINDGNMGLYYHMALDIFA